MLSTAKLILAVSTFASLGLSAPQWGTGASFAGPVVGGLEIIQAGVKEKMRKEAEEATGINLQWYQGGSGEPSHLGLRRTDDYYGYNYPDNTRYMPCLVEDCVNRAEGEGNPDKAWCLYENLCCTAANHWEMGCDHIGVDRNNRNQWCDNTADSYGLWYTDGGNPMCY